MLHYETLALNFFCMGRMETWSGQFTKFPHEMCVSTSFPFAILYAFCDYTVEGCYRAAIFVPGIIRTTPLKIERYVVQHAESGARFPCKP